jgi:hypothetical protein
VTETDEPNSDGSQTDEQANTIRPLQDRATAPSEREIAERDNQHAAENREKFIYRPLRRFIGGFDKHNGLVTAAATAAIAFLTLSLSIDSSRQASTANEQFKIMRDQLDEMKRTREAMMLSEGADVFVGEVVLKQYPSPDAADGGRSGIVDIFYRNGGKIPGYVTRAFLVFAADKPPLPPKPQYPTWHDESSAHAIVPTGDHGTKVTAFIEATDLGLRPKQIFDEEQARVGRSIDVLYVYGQIEYEDRFAGRGGSGPRPTKFCGRYDVDVRKSPEFDGWLLARCGVPAYDDETPQENEK